MSIQQEIDKISLLNSHGTNGFDTYTIPSNFKVPDILNTLMNCISNTPVNENIKNYKMEYYSPMLTFIVKEMNKIYLAPEPDNSLVIKCDQILTNHLLNKLTLLAKGQNLLNKLAHRFAKINIFKQKINDLLTESARSGTFLTFLFWLSRHDSKTIEKLSQSMQENIFALSIGNSDDRLFKFILEKVLKTDKLFLQKSKSTINNMIGTLAGSLVPPKYQLKRLRILSSYISLVPYFYKMINEFESDKVIFELHKYYYENPHDFDSIYTILRRIVKFNWDENDTENTNTLDINNYNKFISLFKTEGEIYTLNILLSVIYNIEPQIKNMNMLLINQIVKNNYKKIIESTIWEKSYTFNKHGKYILSVLIENNLINKYVDQVSVKNVNQYLLLFTRFISIPEHKPSSNNSTWTNKILDNAIKINKLLHHLRLFVKSKCKTKIIQRKVKMFDLVREINTFTPKKSVPVLANGSTQYQLCKQKFSDLPPRHLLPGEIHIYKNFLLREKADGVLIANMPVGIYPYTQQLNNYQVKAEYIEELDLYLVFDIDIPNTTIEERYNILRKLHPYTSCTKIETIDSLDDFINIFKKERTSINNFIKESKSEPIKWYPKFACMYKSNNSNTQSILSELITNIICENNQEIKQIISSSEPFACDGLILTPLDGSREIKIKPKSLMTIDLEFDGVKWIDRNCYDWSNIIIKPSSLKKPGRIYRCYPTESLDKFTVGEFRFDKKKPNPYNIVNNIITMLKYDWFQDTKQTNTYYYNIVKKLNSQPIINTIKAQVENLSSQLELLKPEINKSWLDLGCARGKLIPLIKKFNPKKYLGLDIDVNQLVRGLQYHDENQDVYIFSPCDLAGDWANTPIQWQQINTNIKYDYVVANFSLMHFCTEKFWSQLNEITHSDTKFMFNLVCPPPDTNIWEESDSYLRVENNQTIYKFEWVHNDEKTEPFISDEIVTQILTQHNWKVIEKKTIGSKHKLINFYKWWIITKC